MKKLFTMALMAVFCVACGFTNASNTTKKIERFAGQRITGVDASSAFKVIISQAPSAEASKATVEISDNMVDDLIFTIDDDGVVKVGVKQMGGKQYNNPILKLELVCSSLEEMDLSGATQVKIVSTINTPYLDVDMSGAAKLGGKSVIHVDGALGIEMSGASTVDLEGLDVARADVDLSGASMLELVGAAQSMEIEASGASKADCSKFVTKITSCDISAASRVSLNALVSLTGEASSAASVVCFGGAKVNVKTSSAATVVSK